jgi:hypothetical protein
MQILRLAEAQTLRDAVNDSLFRPSLAAFFNQKRDESVEQLLAAVRQHVRDNQKESRLAGKVEAYENVVEDLKRFAEEQLRGATQ